jgi:16S rRNA C967 or C1407 C5-methylase (RsmB/RsmF family)
LVLTCSRAETLQALVAGPFFDRIVCDVPCSGDGTFRKSPHIWRLFRPRVALELHVIQLQIAAAAVAMLKPGGRMAYSTCSINPIEDEAVISF